MTDQSIREAAQTLAEFAKTAPGRLPERVELAIKAVEAPLPTFSLKNLEAAINGAIMPGETAAAAIERLASVAARLDNKGVIIGAAEDAQTLREIRDLLGLGDHAAGPAIIARMLELLPQSWWTRGDNNSWYRALGSGKRVAQVYRPNDSIETPWRRSTYLDGEHAGRYASASEAMKAADGCLALELRGGAV